MIVVSDTSPLLNLFLIDQLELLHKLYGQVIIPQAVYEELEAGKENPIQPFPSEWIHIYNVRDRQAVLNLIPNLDAGEAESIICAIENNADFLLMDERLGRKIAAQKGIPTIGLLGSLILAKQKGLLETVRPVLDSLIMKAGFWVSPHLYQIILQEAKETEADASNS